MKDKLKGWLFVLIQFLLLALICISSAAEFKYIDRPLFSAIHYIGVTLILIGVLLIMLIYFSFGQYMSPNPVPLKNSILKTTGFYKFIRHPMYLAVVILMTGVILYFQAFINLLWLPVLFLFFIIKSSMEEKLLSKKFPEYISYISRTKRIIPFIY